MATPGTLSADEQRLAELGYKQELHRGWSSFSNFAISFSIICVLAGCFTTYGQAFNNGGPVAISIGWPVISILILTVAFSMSELASAMPTAGGIYYWASKLGGAGWGWFTGWFNLIGLVAVVASVDYVCAQFIQYLGSLYSVHLVERRVAENEGEDAQRYRHAGGPDEQQRTAAHVIDQSDRHEVRHDVHDAGDHRDDEGVLFGEADGVPQDRGIIEDHVDADELLEDREPDPYPHDRKEAHHGSAQVAPGCGLAVPSDSRIWSIFSVSPRLPSTRASTARASSMRPFATRKRGDSGMVRESAP